MIMNQLGPTDTAAQSSISSQKLDSSNRILGWWFLPHFYGPINAGLYLRMIFKIEEGEEKCLRSFSIIFPNSTFVSGFSNVSSSIIWLRQ